MLWSNSAQDWEDSGGKRRVFYIQNTTGEGMQEGRKTLWGDKKGGGCVRFLRTHNGEIVKGQGALMCGKGRQPGVFRPWTSSGLSNFARGKRVDTVSWTHVGVGLQQPQYPQMAVSLTGGAQWRRICRAGHGKPKEGRCEGCGLQRSRSLSWYRNPEIRTDSLWWFCCGNEQGRAGNMGKERAGESGEERERREAWGEKCAYHKKQ